MELDSESVHSFQENIMDWWSKNARNLSWRKNPSPYQVLVSEIMLQQTQVNRVIPKYEEFLQEFPTIEDLASAETKHLLTVWSGLGYNRRAIWLREAANEIVKLGEFPREVKELRKLKGIGDYTSRSILIFAFNKDVAAVDTNIRRVFIASGFADESMNAKEVQDVADTLLLKGRSSDWHNALMDYGSQVLTSTVTGIAPTSKQPCFRGSTREIRGAIIRVLTKIDRMTLDELIASLEVDCTSADVAPVLDQLVTEKLIESTHIGEYKIVE